MNDFKQISERLKRIANYIDNDVLFADIGSDHAYLPSYICFKNKSVRAIAGEVSKGPFERSKQTVQDNGFSDQIDVRLGDGLEVVKDDRVETIVIAGMGGSLISSILHKGSHKLAYTNKIITQPNTNSYIVRKTLYALNYVPVAEEIIEENGHIYEIIVSEPNMNQIRLDENDFYFGPILRKEKNKVFIKKWQQEKNKTNYILQQLQQSKSANEEKIALHKKTLHFIEEVLS